MFRLMSAVSGASPARWRAVMSSPIRRPALVCAAAAAASRVSQPVRAMAKAAAAPAKGKKKDDKKEEKSKPSVAPGELNMEPLAVFKTSKAPAVLPNDQYPDWLFTIDQPLPGLAELRKRDFDAMNDIDRQRMLKLSNRLRIKASNALKKKK